jgi:hypothetical protein
MSEHQEWKMIHLLYRCSHASSDGKRRVLTEDEFRLAGVHCEMDTWYALVDAGIVTCENGEWALTKPAREIVRHFTVGKLPGTRVDIRVDYPEAFVIMPFSEPWSDDVYDNMLVQGIENAGFSVVRGDEITRVGDLNNNVWHSITQAGVIIVEASVPNPNVYYEIGLATALGKPIFIYKQENCQLPADFGGTHYYEYDIDDLDSARLNLTNALTAWADYPDHQPFGVQEIEDRN